jgi:hypothetical protein
VPSLTGLGRRLRDDRGGVTALVAVLFSSGVLLLMTAYAVDIGTLYAERAQLVSGANSAAMAAAQECARPGGACGNPAQAQPLLDGNASDGTSHLVSLCGVDMSTGGLGACPSTAGASRCVVDPPSSTSYAEVHSGTRMRDGSFIYPPAFAGAVVPGYTGTEVKACSRVAWGPPQGPYAPFALSMCQFDNITGGMASPTSGGFNDPYPATSPSSVVPINFQEWNGTGCGGFALLNHPVGTCGTGATYAGTLYGTVDNRRGNSLNSAGGCQSVVNDAESAAKGHPYLRIPIYTAVSVTDPDTGAATFTGIVGIAAFQLTGDKLNNGFGTATDWLTSPSNSTFCGPGTTPQSVCLRGYFLFVDIIDGTMPASGWPRTLGVSVFKTVG